MICCSEINGGRQHIYNLKFDMAQQTWDCPRMLKCNWTKDYSRRYRVLQLALSTDESKAKHSKVLFSFGNVSK